MLNLKTVTEELTGLIRGLRSCGLIDLFLLADLAVLFMKRAQESLPFPKLLPSVLVTEKQFI